MRPAMRGVFLPPAIAAGLLVLSLLAGDRASSLPRAALRGDAAALRAHRADINGPARDGFGWTALGAAAFAGQTEVVRALLADGADPNQAAAGGLAWTPLHEAAYGGHTETVVALLAGGADPNARDEHGRTPLHALASTGFVDTAGALISHGADVNAADAEGRTPLHWAAAFGQAELTAALLRHGARPNARDHAGLTPLHAAALEPSLFGSVRLARGPASWSNIIESGLSRNQLANAVHGALTTYDLPDLARVLGDHLVIEQPVNALSEPAGTTTAAQ